MAKEFTPAMAILGESTYTPNRLLNYLFDRTNTKGITNLGQALGLDPSTISRIEKRKLVIGPGVLIAIMDLFPDVTLQELRKLAGMPKEYRPRYEHLKYED